VTSASLGPVHSSKVSKAIGKKRPGFQRRPNASPELSSGDPPVLTGPDIDDPRPQTASIPPRRSRGLEPPELSTVKGPTGDYFYRFTQGYRPIKAQAERCRQSEIHGLGKTSGNIQEIAFDENAGEGEKET
jgi:hypothetical protein